ncbi:MAG: hypothetical protein EBU08_00285 [Micrococcales bacterium]|nr:hypothetical protein [Micrococcales bacterium]
MRIAWKFYDPVEDEEYEWEINPKDGGYPNRSKALVYESTAAPNGQTLAYEGREAPASMSFSGVILTEQHFDTLTSWYLKRNQIKLTDDLGREFWIYIKSFNPTRVRSAKYPWRHNYTIEAIVLDW